jgi:hypothetical protein
MPRPAKAGLCISGENLMDHEPTSADDFARAFGARF